MIENAAGTRFLTYDSCKELLKNKDGKVTSARAVLGEQAAHRGF